VTTMSDCSTAQD